MNRQNIYYRMKDGNIICNGELEDAWEAYQAAEEAQKVLDQQILADYETGGGH